MQNTLTDLLRTDHILVNMNVKDAQEAIQTLTAALVETGHVSPGFAEDVWRREQTFPTGLPTQPLAVAIPHADPDHVNKSAVCIGVLNAPVLFAQMGTDGSTSLDARLIFLLAIKEREKQVEMIGQLVKLIQTGSLLEDLAQAKDSAEALALIHKTLA
ncbi:MAG: PTS sugar transporter subunit IIA [Anaerolineaceae bacterium]|nr:MAG: PTS sugar transporter subunit IIA [Anaerolineaceae bacterium]